MDPEEPASVKRGDQGTRLHIENDPRESERPNDADYGHIRSNYSVIADQFVPGANGTGSFRFQGRNPGNIRYPNQDQMARGHVIGVRGHHQATTRQQPNIADLRRSHPTLTGFGGSLEGLGGALRLFFLRIQKNILPG